MKKRLIILENDCSIRKNEHRYVYKFKENYTGEIKELMNIRNVSHSDIFKEFSNCTDIAFQSSLIGGSEHQVPAYLRFLIKIDNPINVYMKFWKDTKKIMLKWFTPSEITELDKHSFFILHHRDSYEKIDFSDVIHKYKEELRKEKLYRDSANTRVIGKVKVLGCTAHGKAFENLPIGKIVDVLDMSKQDSNPNRGVWIQGNSEPIKLVNDCGLQEYENILKDKTPDTILNNIFIACAINDENYSELEIMGFLKLLENIESDTANTFCELANIPKRQNRQRIRNILN